MEMKSKSETLANWVPCCPPYSNIRTTSHQRSKTLRKMGSQNRWESDLCRSNGFVNTHTTNPKDHLRQSLWHLSVSCKGIEVLSLFFGQFHVFEIKSFQLIDWCACILCQQENINFPLTLLQPDTNCIVPQRIHSSRITVLIVFQIFDFQKVIENSLRCPICKFSILNFWKK